MLVARLHRTLLRVLGPALLTLVSAARSGGRTVLRSKHWGAGDFDWMRLYARVAAYGTPALLLVGAFAFKLTWH